jgi:histidine kinase
MKESTKKYLGFNDTLLWAIGIPLIAALIPFFFFGHKTSDPLSQLLIAWAISLSMTIAYWIGTRAIVIFWHKRLPEAPHVIRRILLQIATVLVYSFFVETSFNILLERLVLPELTEHPVSGLASTFLIIFLVMAIHEVIYLYAQWRHALVEHERVKREHLRSQLEGLRNQVNPHFLFNSLNTLMSIVTDDQDLAVRYLQKLSSVFRHVLENRNEQLILLSEELEFLNNYIFLQKERFRENLHVVIEIPDKFKSNAIVPLALQLLFENAIKHNIISTKKPLTIEAYINDDNKLEIKNNLQKWNLQEWDSIIFAFGTVFLRTIQLM